MAQARQPKKTSTSADKASSAEPVTEQGAAEPKAAEAEALHAAHAAVLQAAQEAESAAQAAEEATAAASVGCGNETDPGG